MDFSLSLSALEGVFCYIDVFVLEIHEAEFILNRSISSQESIEEAAAELLTLGSTSVFIKGKHLHESLWIHDYWTNGTHSFWLTQPRCSEAKFPETGTVFSAAIAACLALDYSPEDSIIIAKMYVHQAIRFAKAKLYYGSFPEDEADLPYLSSTPLHAHPRHINLPII